MGRPLTPKQLTLIADVVTALRGDKNGDFTREFRTALIMSSQYARELLEPAPPGWPTWGDKFIYHLELTGIISDAQRSTPVRPTTYDHYVNKKDALYCKEFAEAVKRAQSTAADLIESVLRGQALKGNVKAATFLLRGLKPDVYGNRQIHEGPGGGAIQHDLNMPQIRNLLAQRLGALPAPHQYDDPPTTTTTTLEGEYTTVDSDADSDPA